jgi:hypothetical protein
VPEFLALAERTDRSPDCATSVYLHCDTSHDAKVVSSLRAVAARLPAPGPGGVDTRAIVRIPHGPLRYGAYTMEV